MLDYSLQMYIKKCCFQIKRMMDCFNSSEQWCWKPVLQREFLTWLSLHRWSHTEWNLFTFLSFWLWHEHTNRTSYQISTPLFYINRIKSNQKCHPESDNFCGLVYLWSDFGGVQQGFTLGPSHVLGPPLEVLVTTRWDYHDHNTHFLG